MPHNNMLQFGRIEGDGAPRRLQAREMALQMQRNTACPELRAMRHDHSRTIKTGADSWEFTKLYFRKSLAKPNMMC
ncbi:hypothetical protein [Paenibacillus plantiphilus]|uniref:hypothetical protein n=1 Tax=Paenibacillus plantiphilus TaxID=2905650 RepID=UPI001F319E2C|nr:hypothetical protein [Paenibacillus plantiphilus]